MKDFSPGKRRQFGGRNSGGPSNRSERRSSGREERGESRFQRRDGERSSSESSERFSPRSERREDDRERKFERHTVTCDSCHQRCEVPFKPTGNKPVYCSDCFKKKDHGPSMRSPQSSENMSLVHEKLDKIMRALNIQ